MAMTTGPANPDNEPDLQPDPQLAAAYRAAADVLPPPQLDDAIRAAARREVGAGPRHAVLRRWSVPLSLVAVVVLSVTLVTQMHEQDIDHPKSMILQMPAESAPGAPAAEEAKLGMARLQEKAAPQAPAGFQSAPPRLPEAPTAPVPATDPQPAAGSRGVTGGGDAGATAEAMEDRSARRERVSPLLRSAPAPGMASDSGAASEKSASTAATSTREALWQDLAGKAPAQWRQRILEWRRAGRTADAEALAAEFRRRFPDQSLPER
jgi:hypothetical protein